MFDTKQDRIICAKFQPTDTTAYPHVYIAGSQGSSSSMSSMSESFRWLADVDPVS